MIENQPLLAKLQKMLRWKESKEFYSKKLGISVAEVELLMKQLKNGIGQDAEVGNYIADLEERIVRFEEDLSNGTGEVVANCKDEIKSLEDLIKKCNIDINKWEVTKYVQNYWGNSNTPHWQVKAWLSKKKEEQVFQDEFIKFLETYKSPEHLPSENRFIGMHPSPAASLVINKQDAHYNKLDINGMNDIDDRFRLVLNRIKMIVDQAGISNELEEIVYIIGSDEFNSEYTSATTKGTPQDNIHSYHESFKLICDHEIEVLDVLLSSGATSVKVIYVPGNHDEYVGWHLISWLSAHFRNYKELTFDTGSSYRKYYSFGKTAIMFNHGDAIKPAKLAGIFPIEFKEDWSKHDNFYIFTGDKHHELSQDFNGIKFYQIPAFSTAKSKWDDKNGHVGAKGEVTAFLIDEEHGMTNIFKQYL